MHMNGGYTAGDRLSAGFTTARLETAGAVIGRLRRGKRRPLVLQGYRFQVFSRDRGRRLHHAPAIGREAAAADVRGHAFSCGRFLPEEAPGEPLGARRPILHN
jgi:hypothetical protein